LSPFGKVNGRIGVNTRTSKSHIGLTLLETFVQPLTNQIYTLAESVICCDKMCSLSLIEQLIFVQREWRRVDCVWSDILA